ncbi:MAG: hypothetical protein QOC61_1007 [Acidobacteriota bacterium]|jgi:hypothetical protein|nr:hypothetical protein [Acidobacteriota bacterium]
MALFEGKTPAERNKMIAAIVLPLLALIFVVRMLSGPSTPSGTNANASVRRTSRATGQPRQTPPNANTTPDTQEDTVNITEINCCAEPYVGPDAGRNIFAFYVKPEKPVGPVTPATPEPTPPPPPPLVLASLAPQSVFARTGNFTLQVSGDKFGPAARVYIDGQELPTQYKSMQQLTATVPAALIANPGQRPVIVRTPDGKLFSNPQTLNVMQPPAPTYTYVGFLKRARANGNTAVLKDQKGELYSVHQGELVEGRFRVIEISERGVEVVDKDLNIKHTMPFVDARGTLSGRAPGSIQPPPPSEEGDEEP